MSEPEISLDLGFDQQAGIMAVLSPLVRRIIAPNPGPMTFRGTCTYVVGRGDVAVIDPGPDDAGHVDAILAALPGEQVAKILVTHTHLDHSPAARQLKAKTGTPIIGCAPYAPARPPHGVEVDNVALANDLAFTPDQVLDDGNTVTGDGFTLTAVATPGHTMNHLAFALVEEQALFSGDHVMAWSTTIVSPPTGSMAAYMASLEKLRQRPDRIYWPGHGGPVKEPQRFVRALQHHRRQREHAILSRIAQGDETATAIVAAIYENLEPRLKRAAAYSVLAHLEDLRDCGRIAGTDTPGIAARFTPV